MSIHSISVGFIILPFTFKDVPVYMPEFSLSMSFVLSPKTLIPRTIRPNLSTFSVPHIIFPVSFVDCSVGKLMFFLVFKCTSIRVLIIVITWSIFITLCLVQLTTSSFDLPASFLLFPFKVTTSESLSSLLQLQLAHACPILKLNHNKQLILFLMSV
jgi:hypothetical protein